MYLPTLRRQQERHKETAQRDHPWVIKKGGIPFLGMERCYPGIYGWQWDPALMAQLILSINHGHLELGSGLPLRNPNKFEREEKEE